MRILGPLLFDAFEVIAMREGRKTQHRDLYWEFAPQTGERRRSKLALANEGDLFWLAEPFGYWASKSGTREGIGFRSDVNGGIPRMPDHLKNIPCRFSMCEGGKLLRSQSVRTLRVIAAAGERLGSLMFAEVEAMGVHMEMQNGRPIYGMPASMPDWAQTPQEAFRLTFRRRHLLLSRLSDAELDNVELAAIKFELIEENVDVYADRMSAVPARSEASEAHS
jgi:hypothetical protein